MRRTTMLAITLLLGGGVALADATFPSRTVTIISPYPAGGAGGDTAQVLADGMAGRLGQPVIVEHIGGAGATIGTARVTRATPDGHTLLVHNLALASGVSTFPNLTYDPAKDLAGVGLLHSSPLLLVGRKTLPATTLPELLDWLKTAPAVKVAAPGIGNIGHLCGTLLASTVGRQFDMIPYRGGGPALNDVIAGHVDLFCSTAQGIIGAVRGGLVKAFGVTAKGGLASLPDVPGLPDHGLSELDIVYWMGLFTTAGTPAPAIAKLNNALQQTLADPKTVELWNKLGLTIYPKEYQTPEATMALLRSEIERWGVVAKENNIVVPR